MADLNEKYEDLVAQAIDDFMELDPNDEHYVKNGELVEKLYGRYLDEEKLSDERTAKAFERSFEEEKSLTAAEVEKLAHKMETINRGIDVAKFIIFLLANALDQRRIMEFERTGIIKSLAFQRAPKINIKP